MLSLTNASVELARRRVVENVSLQLGAREIVALLGPNGAGKTTLMRAGLGLVPLIVARSDCAAVVPSGLVDLYESFCSLAVHTLPVKLPVDRVELLWHDHSRPDAAHSWLRRTIVAVAKELEQRARSHSFGALATLGGG